MQAAIVCAVGLVFLALMLMSQWVCTKMDSKINQMKEMIAFHNDRVQVMNHKIEILMEKANKKKCIDFNIVGDGGDIILLT
jgi:uncharacterized protein YoxC